MTKMKLLRRATAGVAAALAALLALTLPSALSADAHQRDRGHTPPTTQNPPPDEDRTQPHATSPVAFEFGETLAKLEGAQLEVTFFAAIIPHHRDAIEMAEMELERGASADIRTHAQNIIANQRHQIEQFTRWLREWHAMTPQEAMAAAPEEARAEMAAMEAETAEMMAELEATPAGAPFDVAFVRNMIAHHQGGIVEFLEPQARALHAELRVAATGGIVTQQMEAADFRTWLAAHSGT